MPELNAATNPSAKDTCVSSVDVPTGGLSTSRDRHTVNDANSPTDTLQPDILAMSLRGLLRRSARELDGHGNDGPRVKGRLQATHRRQAEMIELSHALVDNVSHEFRTPLAVLKEFIALFTDGLTGEINDTQREYLQIMATKVNELTLMVNDLLDTSRIEAGLLGVARTPGTVAEMISATRITLAQRAAVQKVRLVVDCPEDLPPVYADMEKAGRALTNLAINSIKFSPEGETVRIDIARDQEDEGMIRVSVLDHGPGIAPEHLAEIFDRFRQVGHSGLAAKGFGLGLAIVKELVQLNLGDVEVASVPQRGSTFSFTLPVYDRRLLLGRFFDRLDALKSDSHELALVDVDVDHDEPSVCECAMDFVNRSLRPFDLFLPTASETRRLIVAATLSAEQVIEQLRRSVEYAYKGLPSRSVPRVTFALRGVFDLDHHECDDIIDNCIRALGELKKEYLCV